MVEELRTIAVKESTAKRLELLKIHQNQSFDEVIVILLDNYSKRLEE